MTIDPRLRQWFEDRQHDADPAVLIEAGRWSQGTPTAVVRFSSGQRLVAQLHATESLPRILAGRAAVESLGVPIPEIVGIHRTSGAQSLTVTRYVDGVSGADVIASGRHRLLARLMGAMARRLRAARFPKRPDGPWRSADALREFTRSWAAENERLRAELNIDRSLERVVGSGWSAGLSHGDFVPVNVRVSGGRIAALLDLGDLAIRHSLLDAAWWCLVVRHFHPEAFRIMAAPFLSAAGIVPTAATLVRLADLALLRSIELSRSTQQGRRAEYLALARSGAAWASAA
jgi:Ser/Thr protein kinase RdoA (MazF antagonist)